MTDFFAQVGPYRATKLDVFAGQRGPWCVDAVLDDTHADLIGKVTVSLGTLQLVGTVQPSASGEFVAQRSLRVVAGGGGWGTVLRQRAYHNAAGVSALTVAQDAARECKETLGGTDFESVKLPEHYVRRVGMGSAVLEHLLGDRQWWVNSDGTTQIGKRPHPVADVTKYQVDKYSPLTRMAELSLDDPSVLWVGSVLSSPRLGEPQTIRDLHLHCDGSSFRAFAFVGGDDSDDSRLGRAVDALLEQRDSRYVWGKRLYRVFSTADDGRVNLQAVRRSVGLPDVLPVSIKPGAPGIWGKLTKGSDVYVEFVDGDPNYPIITGFAGPGDPGAIPEKLLIAGGGAPVARMGDTGVAFFPPAFPVAGTMLVNGEPVPFEAVATITTPAPVQITTGSGIAECG